VPLTFLKVHPNGVESVEVTPVSTFSASAVRRALAVVMASVGVAGGLVVTSGAAAAAVSAPAAETQVMAQAVTPSTSSVWAQQAPATSPSLRIGAAMAYDPASKQLIVFGGLADAGGSVNDTWSFDGTTWTQLTPAHSPSGREYADLTYDPNTSQLVLFGGAGSDSQPLGDTWTWNGTDWTQQTPTTSPSPRSYATTAYDAKSDQLVLFGGQDAASNPLSDTWLWDGTTWTLATPATNPPARNNASMAYDASKSDIVLFGGRGAGHTVLGDTWTWDGTTWTKQAPATSPSPRVVAAMAYNASTDELMLFGGSDRVTALSDTWTWDGNTWTEQATTSPPGPHLYAALAYDDAVSGVVLFGGESSLFTRVNTTWTWGSGASLTATPAVTTVNRYIGSNRVETAVSVSQKSFPVARSAGAVVLASSQGYADALTAAPLAAAHNAPLLLTGGSSLDPSTAREISRVLPSGGTVYVLGGNAAVSSAVTSSLMAKGFQVDRLGGTDRYATALKVADALGDPSTVMLATGLNYPDGITGSVAAAHLHGVLLLTDGTGLPASVKAYLAAHPGSATAIGGAAAKADPAITPVVGSDRYATAALVAAKFFNDPTSVGIASGTAFPDGVAAAAQLAKTGGPLLLTAPSVLPAASAKYLSAVKGTAMSIGIYGGLSALPDRVAVAVDNALVAKDPAAAAGLVLLSVGRQ
jgi:putative cell wall-binding protein